MRDMYISVALFRELEKRHFTVEHNQREHEIKCLILLYAIFRDFHGKNICSVGGFSGMPNSCLEMLS